MGNSGRSIGGWQLVPGQQVLSSLVLSFTLEHSMMMLYRRSYRNRWGNANYILWRVVIPSFVVFVVVQVVLTSLSMTIKEFVSNIKFILSTTILDYFGCALIGFSTWRRFPKIGDALHIREELFMSIVSFVAFCVWLVIMLTALVMIPIHSTTLRYISVIGIEFICSFMLWVMVIYPKRKMDQKSRPSDDGAYGKMSVSNTSPTSETSHGTQYQYGTWQQIVDTNEGYECVKFQLWRHMCMSIGGICDFVYSLGISWRWSLALKICYLSLRYDDNCICTLLVSLCFSFSCIIIICLFL